MAKPYYKEREIIEYITNNPGCQAQDIAEHLGVNVSGINICCAQLASSETIIRVRKPGSPAYLLYKDKDAAGKCTWGMKDGIKFGMEF